MLLKRQYQIPSVEFNKPRFICYIYYYNTLACTHAGFREVHRNTETLKSYSDSVDYTQRNKKSTASMENQTTF